MTLRRLQEWLHERTEGTVSDTSCVERNALAVVNRRLADIVLPEGYKLPDGSFLEEPVRLSTEVILSEIQGHLEKGGFYFSLETVRKTFEYVVTHVDALHHLLAGVYLDQQAGKLKIGRLFRKVLGSYAPSNRHNLAKELVKVDYGRFNADETFFEACAALFRAEKLFAFYDSNKDWIVGAIDEAKKRMRFRSDCFLDDWVCFVYAATETLLLGCTEEVKQEAGNLRERAIALLGEEFKKYGFPLEAIPELAQKRQVRWTKGLTVEDCRFALELLFEKSSLCRTIIDALENCRSGSDLISYQIGRQIGMKGGMIGRNCVGDFVYRKPGALELLEGDPILLNITSGLIAAINGIVAEGLSYYRKRLEESRQIKFLIQRDLGM